MADEPCAAYGLSEGVELSISPSPRRGLHRSRSYGYAGPGLEVIGFGTGHVDIALVQTRCR